MFLYLFITKIPVMCCQVRTKLYQDEKAKLSLVHWFCLAVTAVYWQKSSKEGIKQNNIDDELRFKEEEENGC